jgi:calcineurin-like phosphoesterase
VPQHYHVYLRDGFFSKNQLDSFFDQEEAIIEKKNKKGKRIVVDLKKAVAAIHVVNDKEVTMVLGKDNHQTVRPALVLKTIFQLPERQILTATITKQKGSHV